MALKALPCPIATTVQFIGNKWRVFILRDLMGGPKRYGELRRSIDGISQKVLTENLRKMENEGLVVRKEFSDAIRSVEYSLSELGEALRPILEQLEKRGIWYKENMDNLPQ